MQQRDYSLDAIKGLACIFMILVHANVDKQSGIISGFQFLGGIAPVLFFAVSGVTTTFQSASKSSSLLIIFYIMFAVLGFSYSTIWRPNFWVAFTFDLFQIIAVGVITVTLIEKILKPGKIFYFVLSIIVFLIHYCFTQIFQLQPFPFEQLLFSGKIGEYSYYSFPIFPWVMTFFIGIFAYYIQNYLNLIIGVAFLVILIVWKTLHGGNLTSLPDRLDKWNMSVEYFFFSYSFVLLFFYVFRLKINYLQNNILIYLGKYSLLFLYVHIVIVEIFEAVNFKQPYLVWVSTFTVSYLLMKVLQYINKYIEKFFQNFTLWIIMLVSVCIIPLVIPSTNIIIITELTIGILFANNYQSLSKLLKNYLKSQ